MIWMNALVRGQNRQLHNHSLARAHTATKLFTWIKIGGVPVSELGEALPDIVTVRTEANTITELSLYNKLDRITVLRLG